LIELSWFRLKVRRKNPKPLLQVAKTEASKQGF